MLIHSEILSLLRPSGPPAYLGICVRDTKILVLEEELEAIELIIGIIPIVRILVAQLTVVLLVLLVQIASAGRDTRIVDENVSSG